MITFKDDKEHVDDCTCCGTECDDCRCVCDVKDGDFIGDWDFDTYDDEKECIYCGKPFPAHLCPCRHERKK